QRLLDQRGRWRNHPVGASALLDAGGLASQISQVIELGAPHLAAAHHLDLLDARRIDQERSLDADAVRGDAAHGEVLVHTAGAAADDHALEDLDSLAISFDDLRMHANGVASAELRKKCLQLLLLELLNDLRGHVRTS